jgi:alkylated DNA repair dioxygenase AlkB
MREGPTPRQTALLAGRSGTGDPLPDGFRYVPDFITAREERDLVAHLEALPFGEIRMRGQVARRSALQFGYDYGYNAGTVTPNVVPPPPFLDGIRERVAGLIGRRADELAMVLALRYPPGAAIGWHRDRPVFGPEVVGVSLLAEAVLRLRPPGATRGGVRVALAPRAAYVLAGPARSRWQHSVPAVKALRYSVTFRTLNEAGRGVRLAEEVSP